MPRWWLAVGPPANWEVAFELGNIWGLKSTGRAGVMWELMAEGDGLIFYATLPISGVVGYGQVKTTFRQNNPLWPDEVRQNKVLWPLRFEFDVTYCYPREQWEANRIVSPQLRAVARGGFQTIEPEMVDTILKAFPESATIADVAAPTRSLHDQLIDKILTIGRLQRFITEKGYRLNGERLDAVWRRVERSVPTYVFEVQMGGDLYHALGKLKHAFDIWNSNIFLVAATEEREKVNTLLSGTFHEISGKLRFIEVDTLQKLFENKQQVIGLERE